MKLASSVFADRESIPRLYSCDGKDVNPPLTIDDVPREAKSLALIVDDPDAPSGIFTHWVIWNIDPDTKEISEDSVPPGAVQGANSFRKRKYGGPCPPSGTHRYFFRLFALDARVDLDPAKGKPGLVDAMRGHIVGQAETMGTYSRA